MTTAVKSLKLDIGIVTFLVGWVSEAQPIGRKAMPFGGLRFAYPP
jgi:hypothetical protein